MNNVLWTGGWDSTYRVLELVLVKNKPVQPFYVLDQGRLSTEIEIETMNKIKKMVGELSPGAEQLIKNPIFIKKSDAAIDPDFTQQYKNLYMIGYLGPQYDWLGRCIKKLGLENLELCIHKDDKAEFFIGENVVHCNDNNDSFYKLIESPKNPNLNIFKFYHFPLLKMTKVEMLELSQKYGFSEIMEQTWFCHEPTQNKEPCGICNPCRYTKEEGLGRRVPTPPLHKLIKRKLRTLLGRIRRLIKYKLN